MGSAEEGLAGKGQEPRWLHRDPWSQSLARAAPLPAMVEESYPPSRPADSRTQRPLCPLGTQIPGQGGRLVAIALLLSPWPWLKHYKSAGRAHAARVLNGRGGEEGWIQCSASSPLLGLLLR